MGMDPKPGPTDFDHAALDWMRAEDAEPDEPAVEVAFTERDGETYVLMRNTEQPDVLPLVFDRGEWTAFVEGMKDGEFDDLG